MADNPSRRSGRFSRRQFLAAGAVGIGGAGAVGLRALAGVVRGESSDLSGTIICDGSNTVLPHAALLAYEFQWKHNRVSIPVRGSGTGAGFQRFARGETAVQNASRPITDEEEALCEENGIEFLELRALLDGIAIMKNPRNDWADCLTADELQEIWRSGSDIQRWSDIRSEWPDERLRLYGRDTASGTFDSFTQMATGGQGNIRNDYSQSSDTNVIVRGVSGSRGAIGFGGAGFYEENQDRVDLLAIDEGDGCIRPERSTIEDRSYMLSRPMFVYLNVNQLDREEVRAFARFYFEEIDEETRERAINADIMTEDEQLRWTQWAARTVGFYAADESEMQESEAELKTLIEERTS